jgi:hypothetical protein
MHTPYQHGAAHSDQLPEAQAPNDKISIPAVRSELSTELSKAREALQEVLEHESAQGLRPAIWETPYGSAGIADDAEAAAMFGTTWQRRAPIGRLPWIVQSDADGQLVLPAYVDGTPSSGPPTVREQLDSAKALLMCRGCVASAFLPVSTSSETVERYVDSLRAMGYRIMDPGIFARDPGRGVDAYELPLLDRLSKRFTEARLP